MARLTLNDKAVRKPAPNTGQIELWDKALPGFGLRIAAGGSRTYFVMKRLNGKLVRRSVGKAPPPDVPRDGKLGANEFWPHDARDAARKMLSDLARGIDTVEVAKTKAKTPETFGEVAKSYFADASKRGGASLRTRAELERKVRVDLADWSVRAIGEITRADVRELINAKHATSPVSANRLLALVRRILRWAVREGLISANPAMDLDAPAQEVERDRVLSLDELRRVWAGAEALGSPYGPLIQVLMLTAQRRSEVAGLRWSEISGNMWRLPDERAKRGKGHAIPLSPRVRSILGDLPKIGTKPELAFTTGRRAAKKGQRVDPKAPPAPVSGWSRLKARLDRIIAEQEAKHLGVEVDKDFDPKPYALSAWTLHDIRRSVATHLRDAEAMGDNRVERLTVSKILNHAEGGMTRIYDRYSSDPEKKAALEAWAVVIERLCGLNVVPLNGAKGA